MDNKVIGALLLGFAAYQYSKPPQRIQRPPRPAGTPQNNYAQWVAYARIILAQAQTIYGSINAAKDVLFGPGGIFYKEPTPDYDAGSMFWEDASAGLAGVNAVFSQIPTLYECKDGYYTTSGSRRACRTHGGLKDGLPVSTGSASALLMIRDIKLTSINHDTKKYQGRDKAFSERSVQNIVSDVQNGKFIWENLDPITLFEDQNGQLFVLSGHSRVEAFARLAQMGAMVDGKPFTSIPAKIVKNMAEETAKRVALESNTLSTKETDTERAAYYRRLRQDGTEEKEIQAQIKKNEGRNWPNVYAYTWLNPEGQTWATLKNFVEGSDQSATLTKNIAKWIGSARRTYPLTNAHENELYQWLFLQNGYGTGAGQVKSEQEFADRLSVFVGKNTEFGVFFQDKPLNIKGALQKSPVELEHEAQLKDVTLKISLLQKQLTDKTKQLGASGASRTDIARILEPMERQLRNLRLDYTNLMQKRDQIISYSKNEVDLFGGIGRIGKIYKTAPPGQQMCRDGAYTTATGGGACSYHGGMATNKQKERKAFRAMPKTITVNVPAVVVPAYKPTDIEPQLFDTGTANVTLQNLKPISLKIKQFAQTLQLDEVAVSVILNYNFPVRLEGKILENMERVRNKNFVILERGGNNNGVRWAEYSLSAHGHNLRDRSTYYKEMPTFPPAAPETITRGFHVRDTLVRPEVYNNLPLQSRKRIIELVELSKKIGYRDVRTEMGPNQWARTSQRERKQIEEAQLKMFAIENEVKQLLKSDDQKGKEALQAEKKAIETRLLQMRNWMELVRPMAKYQSPRPNKENKSLRATEEETRQLEQQLQEINQRLGLSGIFGIKRTRAIQRLP